MRTLLTALAVLLAPAVALAGHTRPGYVDGCQSPDGRYVVTAESKKDPKGADGWQFTWRDTKTGEAHTGWLVGLPYGLEHFHIAYAHVYVPPGGQTFAVVQTANFAPCDRKPPGAGEKALNPNPTPEFKNYAGFADRVVVYRKTGEVVKRLAMADLLRDDEWRYVNWVHANLYWLREYPDVTKNGEPPRSGWRYLRVSPDYTVLEFTVGPNADAQTKLKASDPQAANYGRRVWVSLVDGALLDPDRKPADPAKLPGRPFVGDLVKRGDAMLRYVPSLDPVRVAGTYADEKPAVKTK
ncbi:MAG TPA: hypothetical protein VF796_03095 [Humisphaera sp.]